MKPIAPTRRMREAFRLLMIAFLALLASQTLATGAWAQNPPLRFRHLSADDGLSDSTTEAIVQDRRGFMWFGTADGLNRYDGYTLTHYYPDENDPNSLSHNYIWDLFVDQGGVLWIGTAEGLNRYIPETDSFVRYLHDDQDSTSLSSSAVNDVFEDRQGTLWVGSNGGLNRLDRSTGTFVRYLHDDQDSTSLSNAGINVTFEDCQGRLWVGTEDGLNLYDRETNGFSHYRHDPDDAYSLSNNFVRTVFEDSQGLLWVGTENGLNRLDPEQPGRFVRYQHDTQDPGSIRDNLVWTIHEDRRGTLWIGTDRGGLAYFDRTHNTFVHYTHDPHDPFSISSNVVSIIYEDDSGDLWTGNYAGGVNFLDRTITAFAYYRHDPYNPRSLNHSSVLAFFEDASGRIWVGTEDGLARFDRASGHFTRYQHDPNDATSLSAPAVLSIHEDRDGVLWVGTYAGGLNRFDRQTGTFTRYFPKEVNDPSAGTQHVWSIHEDRNGYLWIGTFAGLHRLDRATGTLVSYTADSSDPTSLPQDIIWDIHEDRKGRLWLGTEEGLSLYDRDRDAFVNYNHDQQDSTSLSNSQITSIFEDNKGRLWIATQGGGVNLFDPEQQSFADYRKKDGLPSDLIFGILEDRRGNLWISTNKGLSRFDPDAGTFTNYDQNDGLQGQQFNRNAFLKSRTGELFFGGISGFNIFDPDNIQANAVAPPVVITDFQVFNEAVAIGEGAPLQRHVTEAETITLRHDQSVFSFAFAALNYRNSSKNQYAYMLENFDTDWVYVGDKRDVTYTNLDPGSYVFRVKGSNNDGVWNEQGASVHVIITPPFWARWWFRLLIGGALATVLFAAYAARTRAIRARAQSLKEMNEQLEIRVSERARELELAQDQLLKKDRLSTLGRLTATVAHELRNPLATIGASIRVVEVKIPVDRFGLEKTLQRIRRSVTRCDRIIEELLSLTRGRVGPPVSTQLDTWLDETLDDLMLPDGVTFRKEFGAPDVVVTIDPDRLRQAVVNVVANANQALEGGGAEVTVRTRTAHEQAEILVLDTGPGIAEDVKDRIFEPLFSTKGFGVGLGLSIVEQIMKEHDGGVDIRDREVQGTEVRLWLPIGPSQTTLEETQ